MKYKNIDEEDAREKAACTNIIEYLYFYVVRVF